MEKRRKVLVGGCFDVLHYGHIAFLQSAKAQGDWLIVALEPDSYIQSVKNRKPYHTEQQRKQILLSLRMVDEVIILPHLHTDKDYLNVVKKIKPDIIAITKGDPQYENKKNQARAVGATLQIVTRLIEGFSTTNIFRHSS